MQEGFSRSLPLAFSPVLWAALVACLLPHPVLAGIPAAKAEADNSACQDLPHSDDPALRLTQGVFDARVFLPDATRGFNRASRFDWSETETCPPIDGGSWTIHPHRRSIAFTQRLKSPIGIALSYPKRLTLKKNQPERTREHRLTREGTKPTVSHVYDHDFSMLDGGSTGPGVPVTVPFDLKAEETSADEATVEGKQVVYRRAVPENSPDRLKGYAESPASYDFITEDQKTGVGVAQSSDHPIYSFLLWSAQATTCSETYIHLEISPGKTVQWKIHYRFFANSE